MIKKEFLPFVKRGKRPWLNNIWMEGKSILKKKSLFLSVGRKSSGKGLKNNFEKY